MANNDVDSQEPEDEVPEELGCPSCGERRVDYLEIDEDDETVRCTTCGRVCRVV